MSPYAIACARENFCDNKHPTHTKAHTRMRSARRSVCVCGMLPVHLAARPRGSFQYARNINKLRYTSHHTGTLYARRILFARLLRAPLEALGRSRSTPSTQHRKLSSKHAALITCDDRVLPTRPLLLPPEKSTPAQKTTTTTIATINATIITTVNRSMRSSIPHETVEHASRGSICARVPCSSR